MKPLIILTCIIYLTKAAPRNDGYTYQTPIGQSIRPSTHLASSPSLSSNGYSSSVSGGFGYSSVGAAGIATPPLSVPAVTNVAPAFSFSGSSAPSTQLYSPTIPNYVRPTLSQSNINTQIQDSGFVQPQTLQRQPAIITKDIYIHSAPDEFESVDIGGPADQPQLPLRKNYKIIFIKTPAHNTQYHAAALKAAQEATEEKTIIYVLTKKPDIQEIHEQVQATQPSTKLHKPEVYFIKYKTPEEAQHAQQQIQAQYEKLGGSTRVTDAGVAPVTSVIGSLSSGAQQNVQTKLQNGQQSFDYSQGTTSFGSGTFGSAELPSRNYLPAKLKK